MISFSAPAPRPAVSREIDAALHWCAHWREPIVQGSVHEELEGEEQGAGNEERKREAVQIDSYVLNA